jgi:response regulator of citrate/malate metabolism
MNMANQDIAGRSVLIVDDDTFFHAVLGQMLAVLGIDTIHTASNGNEALRVLKALPRPTDYLICDVFMPDMDGIEFLDVLAQKKYAGHVVLVSGMNMDMMVVARDVAVGNGLNVLGAFVKPVKADVLAHVLGLDMQFKTA